MRDSLERLHKIYAALGDKQCAEAAARLLAEQSGDTRRRNVLSERLAELGAPLTEGATNQLYNPPHDDPAVDMHQLRQQYAGLDAEGCRRELKALVTRMADRIERVSVIVAQLHKRGGMSRFIGEAVALTAAQAMGDPPPDLGK
jgi:hypothetical protein